MAKTNLLCTFAHRKDLNLIVDYVKKSYTIVEKKIFVFNDADKPNDVYVTYNVDPKEDYKVYLLRIFISEEISNVSKFI